MPDLKLSLACWDYDRTRPLMDGRVKPEGIDLDIQILRPRQAFQRMLDSKEFQVSELSLASYTALKGRGDCRRCSAGGAVENLPPLLHLCAQRRRHQTPADLRGKRVGTSQWARPGWCSCAACCSTTTA
jgi:4,5-dihydroxyphthalate decarboxylase